MTFVELLKSFFLDNGMGWMVVGLFSCLMLGGLGSSKGLFISGNQMAGILSEKPDLFGKLLVIMALPGTQGVYAFVLTFAGMIILKFNAAGTLSMSRGIVLFFCFVFIGIVQYLSAVYQGKNSAAAINLVAKQPDKAGGAILIPAMVETYALLAFVAGFVLLIFISGSSL